MSRSIVDISDGSDGGRFPPLLDLTGRKRAIERREYTARSVQQNRLSWGRFMATVNFQTVRHALAGASTTESHIAERVVLMCASALFTGLSQQECMEIASCAKARTFARDELLFMQGQPVRNLVLIQTGRVKLTQLSPSGNEVILWMNSSGDTVGVPADTTACSHTCSARAMEQCRALTWEYTRLQNLLVEYPQIRNNINQILSNRRN